MMWAFFWFILGAAAYALLSLMNRIADKAVFIQNIKIIAFQLICSAFEDLVFARALKYKSLFKDETIDEEKIKIYENEDENFMRQWKKDTVKKLQSSVPPLYRKVLDVESWEALMSFLELYYKKIVSPVMKKKIKNDSK